MTRKGHPLFYNAALLIVIPGRPGIWIFPTEALMSVDALFSGKNFGNGANIR